MKVITKKKEKVSKEAKQLTIYNEAIKKMCIKSEKQNPWCQYGLAGGCVVRNCPLNVIQKELLNGKISSGN